MISFAAAMREKTRLGFAATAFETRLPDVFLFQRSSTHLL